MDDRFSQPPASKTSGAPLFRSQTHAALLRPPPSASSSSSFVPVRSSSFASLLSTADGAAPRDGGASSLAGIHFPPPPRAATAAPHPPAAGASVKPLQPARCVSSPSSASALHQHHHNNGKCSGGGAAAAAAARSISPPMPRHALPPPLMPSSSSGGLPLPLVPKPASSSSSSSSHSTMLAVPRSTSSSVLGSSAPALPTSHGSVSVGAGPPLARAASLSALPAAPSSASAPVPTSFTFLSHTSFAADFADSSSASFETASHSHSPSPSPPTPSLSASSGSSPVRLSSFVSGDGKFGQGLAYAQAAEENERAGDAETALGLYIKATECLFAVGPDLEDLEDPEIKRVLEHKLRELVSKVEHLLARQPHTNATPGQGQPQQAATLSPISTLTFTPAPASASSPAVSSPPSASSSLLPKLPPPPSPHRAVTTRIQQQQQQPRPRPQSMPPQQQEHQKALFSQRLLSMSISSDEDEFNPFPASPLLTSATIAAAADSHHLHHHQQSELAQKRHREQLAEALGRGWGQPATKPTEDLLCSSPRLTSLPSGFVDSLMTDEGKAKESTTSGQPQASSSSSSSLAGARRSDAVDDDSLACPICGDEFTVAAIEKHAAACLDRMDAQRDKARRAGGFLNSFKSLNKSLFGLSSSSSSSSLSSSSSAAATSSSGGQPRPAKLGGSGGSDGDNDEGFSLLDERPQESANASSAAAASAATRNSTYPSLQALEPSEGQRYSGSGSGKGSSRSASPRRPRSNSRKNSIGTVVDATSSNYATVTYLRQGIRRSAESVFDKSSVTYDDSLTVHTYPLIEAISSSTVSMTSVESTSTSASSSASSASISSASTTTLSTGPEFVDHAPLVFHRLRAHFGVSASAYLASMGVGAVEGESFSTIVSPGKSGAHFYFSPDTRYIIKTIHEEEFQFFRDNVFSYYEHMASNKNSLLTRFFALYTVRSKTATHHFVVMENLFPCDLPVHEAYDLKGSMAGRFASEQELMNKEIAVLKDINFQKNRKLVIGREKRQIFFRQLELDCQWLEDHGVMDYSLLLLIHKNTPASATASPSPPASAPATAPPSPSAFSALSALCSPPPSTPAPPASSAAKETGGGKPLYPSLHGGSSPLPRDATAGGGFRAVATESVFRLNRGGLASMDDFDEEQGEIYFMAIIDILQPYNWRKRLENTYKKLFENEEAISCVDPTKYSNRFVTFIKFQTQGVAHKA